MYSNHPLRDSVIVRKDYTDSDLTAGKIALIVFMSIMNVFMFLGNTLSIVTICSTPKLRQQVSYWFVLNLAIIDLIISITIVPLNTAWEYYGIWPLSKPTCQFFTFADMSFSTISAYSIVMVSIDKYIYVTYALQYYERMTRRTAVIMIVTVWMFVIALTTWWLISDLGTGEQFKDHFLELDNGTETCVYILTDTYIVPSVVLSFFAPLLVLCFTSSRIVCIASRHLRTIQSFDKPSPSVTYSDKYSTPTRPQVNTISASVQANKCEKGVDSETTLYTDCSNKPRTDTSPKVNKETTEKARYEETGITADTSIDGVKPSSNNMLYCFFCKLWTKLSHRKSKHSCNLHCDIPEGQEVMASMQSINPSSLTPSSSTQLTTDLSSTPNGPKPVHKTFSAKSLQSTHALARRRPTISTPLMPYCKLFGTVTIVIICFVVMFAPFNIAVIVDVTCHCVEPWVYEDILSVLYYMHSLVNPYIYMATDRKYKAALRLLWKRVKRNFNRHSIG